MDLNYTLGIKKIFKPILEIMIVLAVIFSTGAIGFNRYNTYVVATSVPLAPTITAAANEDKTLTLTITCNEERKNHENIIYISDTQDGKYTEFLKSKEDTVVVSGLEQGKAYFFKAKIKVNYNKEEIVGYASNFATATVKKDVVMAAPKKETVTVAPAIHNTTDAWAGEVERQLYAHGVYTDERKAIILNIIHHESNGREHAVGAGGEYVGLVQFGSHWKHDYPESYFIEHGLTGAYQEDNRYSGSWSIHKLVETIVRGGDEAIKRHWPNTWNK